MVVMMGAWAQTVTHVGDTWTFTMPDANKLLDVDYWNAPQLAYSKVKDTTYTGIASHTYPTLTNSHNVKVRYGSSNPTVATVDKESGVVTPLTVGVTVIYAVHPADTAGDSYTYDSVAYTLTVKEFPGGDGSENDPYLIPSLEIWNLLAAKVNAGKAYSGKYFKQTANIENVTTMVGTCGTFGNESTYKQFGGNYNGDGHTLTVDITSTNRAVAPFRFVNGATIRNLKTAGTVKGNTTAMDDNGMDIAGIVANSSGETRIVNCISSVALESNKPGKVDAGGIVSYVNSGKVTIDGCAFTGSFNYTDPTGYEGAGIVRWSGVNGASVTNCLFAPSSIAITDTNNFKMFFCSNSVSDWIANCYYNDKAENFVLDVNKQGKKADTIAAGANVTSLAIDGTAFMYNVSGITCYSKSNIVRSGIMYDGVLYGGAGDVLYLALTHANRAGLTFSSYSATSGTISVSGSDTILTKAAGKSVISADYTATLTVNAEGNGTVSGGGVVAEGTNVDISATPATNYHFVQWNDGNTDNPRTVTITKDSSFTASFAIDTVRLDSIPLDWTVIINNETAILTGYGNSHPDSGYVKIPIDADVVITPSAEQKELVSKLELIDKSAPVVPEGAINGLFSVSANKKVYFSKGNLQYDNGGWQFASNQYDIFDGQTDGIRDLFGWGTGSDPENLSPDANDYDWKEWGENAITNGGNTDNSGWRTLTSAEWWYLFFTRTTTSGVRYAKALVADKPGVILLPDDWSTSYYNLENTNIDNAAFASNVINASTWSSSLEAHGAVFLPAASYRNGNVVSNVGVYDYSYGYYWSSTPDGDTNAKFVTFGDTSSLYAESSSSRHYGYSVRLVKDAN